MEKGLSKSERTKQFIIETTAGIFNTKGYVGTSMSDLTEATGLTKGSIYGNFENKEEVALAAFDYNYAKVTQAIQQRIASAGSYHDKLLVYAQVYQRPRGDSFPKGGCPILNTATEADDTNPLLKERASKAILKWKQNIIQLVRAGVASGEFKPDADPEQMALSIIALIEGGIMIAKVTGTPGHMNSILQTVELLIGQAKA